MSFVLVSGAGHHLDISVLANLEVPGVDERYHHGQGLGVNIINEDFVLPGLLHVPEDHGSQDRGPGVEHDLIMKLGLV